MAVKVYRAFELDFGHDYIWTVREEKDKMIKLLAGFSHQADLLAFIHWKRQTDKVEFSDLVKYDLEGYLKHE